MAGVVIRSVLRLQRGTGQAEEIYAEREREERRDERVRRTDAQNISVTRVTRRVWEPSRFWSPASFICTLSHIRPSFPPTVALLSQNLRIRFPLAVMDSSNLEYINALLEQDVELREVNRSRSRKSV